MVINHRLLIFDSVRPCTIGQSDLSLLSVWFREQIIPRLVSRCRRFYTLIAPYGRFRFIQQSRLPFSTYRESSTTGLGFSHWPVNYVLVVPWTKKAESA